MSEATVGVLPIPFGVAVCTHLSEVLFVLVVLVMAAEAVFWRFLEEHTFMTRFAIHFLVPSQ